MAGKTGAKSSKNLKNKKKQKAAQLAARRRRRIIGWISGILCFAIVIVGAAVILHDKENKHNDFYVQPSNIVDDGMVRVLLRSLDNPRALGLTLDGVYSVDGDAGFRFERGCEITVAQDAGKLYLKSGGLTIDMGGSFSLVRHAPEYEGQNAGGIFINESEKPNLFAGDLKLMASGNGIDCILTLQVEDYLYGVVAYEMSNSFPIEALKAQAIAARTYVMRARESNKSRAYDVVDTTSDQVFKGFDSGLTNVIKAVDETRGIVGMIGGQYGQCYYTASNGGQIASTRQIWGGTVSYIEMKADPYDLENPYSQQKSARLPQTPEHGSKLETAIASALKKSIPDAANIRVDRIRDVSLTDPDTAGSLMYSSVSFKVEASKQTRELKPISELPKDKRPVRIAFISKDESGRRVITEPERTGYVYVLSDWTTCDGTFTAKLPTYKKLKSLLGIGINSGDYEVFSLEKTGDGWTLTARRFGHGIGMSQRGAQTMASKHGKTAEEILSFYYPGLNWYEIDWTQKSLTPISALPDSFGYARAKPTPRPTQQPLPEVTGDEYYATVTATTLNVRSDPGTNNGIVALLYSGEKVIVTGQFEDNWVSIKTVEFTGYVKADYLTR